MSGDGGIAWSWIDTNSIRIQNQATDVNPPRDQREAGFPLPQLSPTLSALSKRSLRLVACKIVYMVQPNPVTSGSPIKILIVDDHPNTANMLARAISQLDPRMNVVSVTSGREALKSVDDGAADILITDMVMPEMTGLELIEKLQHHPAGRPAYSFLITAYDVPGLNVTARRLKVKDIIVKPVRPERVCQIVTKAMEEMGQVRVAAKEPSSKKAFKILVADDQPDNLVLLTRYLETEGYEFVLAKDGIEALAKIRSELPDMPHKDGFAVLEEIRVDPAVQHIPVIILTAARIGASEVQFGLNLGADDYITKPFDRRELFARIRTKLRVKEAEDRMRRRNRELNLLPEIGKEISARLDINELSDIVLRRTVETLGALLGHIFILDPKAPIHKQYSISSSSSIPNSYLPPLNNILERVKESRQSLIIADTHRHPDWQFKDGDSAGSVIVVPMLGRQDLIGLLILTHEQPGYFTVEHQLLLQAIAGQSAFAVENAHLYAHVSKERQQLNAVLQSAADAILMFDAENCLSLLNPAGEKLFTDYDTKAGLPLAHGRGYDSLINLLDQAFSASSPISGEVIWPDDRVFSASITPLQEGGCVVVLHDVTHFKKLEKVKDEFIATASHDLRNPITAINGFNQLIQQAGPLNENQVEFSQRIRHAAENMSELVENMLSLAKMDLGAEPAYELLEVTPMLWKIANEFQPQAEAKEQLLTVSQTVSGSTIRGEAFQLGQGLRNLIGNAIKYTPRGGVVTLSSSVEEGMLSIRIQDTGYGIPAADLQHLFDRFYRVRNTGHDEIEGNGLGLAIVKSIAQKHGGDVTVESEVGKGSCFILTLPLVEEK
jgi:two-component system phosphate regulon sensor histidine kinase PhoR